MTTRDDDVFCASSPEAALLSDGESHPGPVAAIRGHL